MYIYYYKQKGKNEASVAGRYLESKRIYCGSGESLDERYVLPWDRDDLLVTTSHSLSHIRKHAYSRRNKKKKKKKKKTKRLVGFGNLDALLVSTERKRIMARRRRRLIDSRRCTHAI